MGVEKEIISEGDGTTYPTQGQELVMHYTGSLEDGTVFDSSVRKGRPFKFRIGIGQVIQGWDEVNMINLTCLYNYVTCELRQYIYI